MLRVMEQTGFLWSAIGRFGAVPPTLIIATAVLFGTLTPMAVGTAGAAGVNEPQVDAANFGDPADIVRGLGDRATAVLADQSIPAQQRVTQLYGLLLASVDVDRLSRFVLGRYWRKATPVQQAEFTQLFETFIINTFAQHIDDYGGERLKVAGARITGDKRATVSSQITRPEGPLVRADWQLFRGEDKWWIVDVVVEGVSLAMTQRSEFAAVIKNNGGRVEALLDLLRAKTSTMTTVADKSLDEAR